MQRANLLEKTWILAKIDGKRRRGRQRTRWLDGITELMDTSLNKVQDGYEMCVGDWSSDVCSSDLKTLESPLDCKEIKPVNPKGNQP